MVYKFRSLAIQNRKAPHAVGSLKLALIGLYFLSKNLQRLFNQFIQQLYVSSKTYRTGTAPFLYKKLHHVS
jgi:hypothetical protein